MMAHTDDRPTVETDVLIIGAGPAGAALASFLGYNGMYILRFALRSDDTYMQWIQLMAGIVV